jgi:tetratricopeptide (TPR) repeat protein
MTWEAIEAYEAALETDPSNLNALYRQVMLLADMDEARLWPRFARLVEADESGEQVRSAIDSLYHLDDISPATHALQDAADRGKDRHDLYLNLAAAYLVAEKGALARAALEKARSLTQDEDALREIERLLLAARDPDFEARLGEITDLVNAGSSPSIRDVDFLEDTLEKAPRFGEVYLLLAKAYQLWGEPDAVLETLLDAQKKLPDDPDILEMLARVLWIAGEQKLAFDYLNRGLAANPQHIPLLSLTGRYLFENGQEEAARAFLARAEMIGPRHPALNDARVHIARLRG